MRLFCSQANGRTALMEVVINNMLDMTKVLIYGTDNRKEWTKKSIKNIDLSAADTSAKTVVHHCVQNRNVSRKESTKTALNLLDRETGAEGYLK